MADNNIQMPSGFGGLMRYSEGYDTKISLNPSHIIGFVALIILIRIFLPMIL